MLVKLTPGLWDGDVRRTPRTRLCKHDQNINEITNLINLSIREENRQNQASYYFHEKINHR